MPLPIPFTTTAQLTLPSADDSTTIVPDGSSWVSGAWADLTASLPVSGYLTGVSFYADGAQNNQFEIDIAKGAGHDILATFKGFDRSIAGVGDNGMYFPLPIAIEGLTASQKVSARIRCSDTSTDNRYVAITYLPTTLTGFLPTTTRPLKCAPSAANLASANSPATAYTYTAWQDVLLAASNTTGIVIAGIVFGVSTGHIFMVQVQVGTGTAPSGSVITTIKGTCGNGNNPGILMLPNPLAVESGVGIVMRWEGSEGFPFSGLAGNMGILYYEQPV